MFEHAHAVMVVNKFCVVLLLTGFPLLGYALNNIVCDRRVSMCVSPLKNNIIYLHTMVWAFVAGTNQLTEYVNVQIHETTTRTLSRGENNGKKRSVCTCYTHAPNK